MLNSDIITQKSKKILPKPNGMHPPKPTNLKKLIVSYPYKSAPPKKINLQRFIHLFLEEKTKSAAVCGPLDGVQVCHLRGIVKSSLSGSTKKQPLLRQVTSDAGGIIPSAG